MPLRNWICPVCELTYPSKAKAPAHCERPSEQLLTAPNVKLQVTDHANGKSTMQDQEKILKERARNYSRDNELDDLIAKNDRPTSKQNQWLTDKGIKRKAVDDI